MTLFEHLDELRSRILWCVGTCIVLSFCAYAFRERLFELLVAPVSGLDVRFIHVKPYDKFLMYVKISLYTGILGTIPMAVYQLASFVNPGLYAHEKRYFYGGLCGVVLLFFLGVLLVYFYLVPVSLRFLIGFDRVDTQVLDLKQELLSVSKSLERLANRMDALTSLKEKKLLAQEIQRLFGMFPGPMVIQSHLSILEYFEWVVFFLALGGLVLQLPILMMMLLKFNVVKKETLIAMRPYALVCFLVFGALVTPPDVLSQIMIAGPLYMLYEGSILCARFMKL